MRGLRYVIAGAVFAGLFYLVLIDTRELPELYALIGVALLSGLGFALSLEQGLAEVTVSPRWLLRAWRPVLRVPRDIVLVVRAALSQAVSPKAERGALRALRFAGGDGRWDLGRAALTESLGSFAPNSIVVGVDDERNLLIVHQLERDGRDEDLDVLDLR